MSMRRISYFHALKLIKKVFFRKNEKHQQIYGYELTFPENGNFKDMKSFSILLKIVRYQSYKFLYNFYPLFNKNKTINIQKYR